MPGMLENNTTKIKYLEGPDKSENDKKLYKVMKLPNGIKVLLISDPSPVPTDGYSSSSDVTDEDDSCAEESSEKDSSGNSSSNNSSDGSSDSEDEGDQKLAACALMIDVGSFSDPPEIQGLTHFLEHMIFLGSEKFPSENEFDAFIKNCGGYNNGETECEDTCFYFEVSEKHLDGSLERFASLFEHPLMLKNGMIREIGAVDSEFQSVLHDDETRRDQLLALLANPSYPHKTFTWGNSKSLTKNFDYDGLHKKLHEYRLRYYHPERMYVCLQARLPMSDLEDLVINRFSSITSNELSPPKIEPLPYENAFINEFYDSVFIIKPAGKQMKLELTWCLPSIYQKYKTKPENFMANMMGYEGPGSLCSYLRKRLWSMEMLAGTFDSGFETNSIYSLFTVCIFLTEQGFVHIDEVLESTFAYIKLFKKAESFETTFAELKNIEDISFRFQSQTSAVNNVQDKVVNLKYYPPKDIITGPLLYFDYEEKAIKDYIDRLNQFRFNIMITSDKSYDELNFDKTEEWFGTEYATCKIPEKWKNMWENTPTFPELFLPLSNIFIPKDFEILWTANGSPEISPYPKQIMDSENCELWFRQDDKFLLPYGYMYFNLISPITVSSAKNATLTNLYVQFVKYALAEQLYPAIVAGLSYQFRSTDNGVSIKVNGYNEKLHLMVDSIINAMINIKNEMTTVKLNALIDQQRKLFYNTLIKPSKLSKEIRLDIIEHIRWPLYKKYNELNDITLEDMKEFSEIFLHELKIQGLVQGNLTEETAHNVMNSIYKTLNCSKIKDPSLVEPHARQMPVASNFLIVESLNNKDVNSSVCNYYQIGPCTLKTECMLDLLLMFVEEPIYDQLRTKEQLGYDVGSSVKVNYGICGYSIYVNSQEDKVTTAFVDQRIEMFRKTMLTILNNMDAEQFEQGRESLIVLKLTADTSLDEEVDRNWSEIVDNEYNFDRRKREADCLRSINLCDIVEMCVENEKDNFRKISIQVVGHKNKVESTENDTTDKLTPFNKRSLALSIIRDNQSTISNLDEYKRDLYVFPVTKTLMDFPKDTLGSPGFIEDQ